jgi:hypothetical protein
VPAISAGSVSNGCSATCRARAFIHLQQAPQRTLAGRMALGLPIDG